ncbi:MAG TPA: hypothetical protein VFS43_02780 [Polyangiaceae bacterium]|nr:hypothetical protein [Polyangiaceae bacterium]
MSRHSRRSFAAALGLVTLAGSALPSCADDFSTERPTSEAGATLGEDIYSGLCDRVGATSLAEDLTGVSYRSICHKGPSGWGDKVDESKLPALLPTDERGLRARRLSLAKLETMAKRRADTIAALDALFPDVEIDDPFEAGKKVRLYDALDLLTKRMTPLYDGDPYAPGAPPVLPASTRSLGSMLGALAESRPAAEALARIGERRGYRPAAQSLGMMRPLLTSPHLRRSVKELVRLVSAGGPAERPFQAFLAAAEQELRTMQADPDGGPLSVDEGRLQPSRPRVTSELLASALLMQADEFRVGDAPRYLARRDRRGFALPAGALPDGRAPVPAPFADLDGDGFADLDAFGRFVDAQGAPLDAPPPFRVLLASTDRDFTFDEATGRSLSGDRLIYSYLDASGTFAASALRDLRPLVAARPGGAEGGASTLFKALRGARPIFGERKPSTRAYADKGGRDLAYEGFDPATSALPELAHALGQLLAAPESDDYLGFVLDLHEQRPDLTARVVGLVEAILDESRSPKYAGARLDDASTLFDEIAAWLAKVARVGPDLYTGGQPGARPKGLLYEALASLSDPATVELVRQNFAPMFAHKDRISYDPNNLNGPPVNLDTGKPFTDKLAFQTPVDRSTPAEGANASAFKRFVDVVYYADHVKTCNRAGAKVKARVDLCITEFELTYPLVGSIDECGLFEVDELSVFFLDSMLDYNHPRRAKFDIKDETLVGLSDLMPCSPAGFESKLDAAFQIASGIEGFTTKPTPQALTRFVFFGAPSGAFPSPPDLDPLIGGPNANLGTFAQLTTELIGSAVCPKNARGVNTCDSFDQTLRGIIPHTLFMTEFGWRPRKPDGCVGFDCDQPTSDFIEGLRPLITAFANYRYVPDEGEACVRDQFGTCPAEQLFTGLMGILFKHWPSDGSGLWRYEELIDWVINRSDAFGTLAELTPALRDQAYVSPRVRPGQARPGLEIAAAMVPVVFDPAVARSLGVTDRQGSSKALANDGREKDLALFDLFAGALRRSDASFAALGAEGEGRRAAWREARSELVDQFLLARGGAWQNAAVARALGPIGRLMREQLNARCPDREAPGAAPCAWAKDELGADVADLLSGPLFSALADLGDALAADPAAREALEVLVGYLLEQAQDADVLADIMVSAADLVQLLQDEKNLVPVLNAMSVAAAPSGGRATPGLADTSLKLLRALLDDRTDLEPKAAREAVIDRYHVVDAVLKNAVAPVGPGGRSPFEVLAEVVADVHRIDSASAAPLDDADYRAMGESLKGFLTDPYRGLEQFYTIIRDRNGN